MVSPTQKVKEPRNKTAETKSMMKNNDINKTKNRKETKGKIIEMAKKKKPTSNCDPSISHVENRTNHDETMNESQD